MAKSKTSTGMGSDAFFQNAPAAVVTGKQAMSTVQEVQAEARAERRSFNLKPSTLRLLDEIQIKTIRDGDKWTLSAIVELGIERVAKEMGVHE